MSIQSDNIQRELKIIENSLLDRAMTIQNLDQFLSFFYSYLSIYLPVVEFAVESLPENSIARLANFGMLIDHLSHIQINRLLNAQLDLNARELSEATSKPKTAMISILEDITIAQKIQISSTLLLANSMARDAVLSSASSKFNAINKIITWANIFSRFIDFPAVAELFLSEDILNEAENELEFARKHINQKDRPYDYELSREWSEVIELPRQAIESMQKMFIGPKLTWLIAMEGLELMKFILKNDTEAAERSLLYNEKILDFIKNENIPQTEWSYRNLNSGGPCCDITKVINSINAKNINLSTVDNHTIFIQSDLKQFFVIIPPLFSFYTNPKLRSRISSNLSIPLSQDIGAIVLFYKNPALFVAANIKSLSLPQESDFYLRKQRDREIIKKIVSNSNSIITKLTITYNNKVDLNIIEGLKKTPATAFQAVILYGILYSFEKLAKEVGLPVSAEAWSDTRLTITSILLVSFDKVSKKVTQIAREDDKEMRKRAKESNIAQTSEDRIRLLNKKIEESEQKMREMAVNLQDAGLLDLMNISREIRNILLSGLSPEEILQHLKNYCSSIQENPKSQKPN